MNKKIFFIFILLVALISISAVSAETKNVGGINFTIPEGYTQNEDFNSMEWLNVIPGTVLEELTGEISAIDYRNGQDVFVVMALPSNVTAIGDIFETGDAKKTISGKDGLLSPAQTNPDVNQYVSFKYVENGYIYVVVASNESIIENAIPT